MQRLFSILIQKVDFLTSAPILSQTFALVDCTSKTRDYRRKKYPWNTSTTEFRTQDVKNKSGEHISTYGPPTLCVSTCLHVYVRVLARVCVCVLVNACSYVAWLIVRGMQHNSYRVCDSIRVYWDTRCYINFTITCAYCFFWTRPPTYYVTAAVKAWI